MIYARPARGTGGAGAQGILQGLIAGQNSRESSQRMDMLQAQNDRNVEQYESKELNERMYNIKQIYNDGGNISPALNNLNKWKSGSTNFNDGEDFRSGNWSDYHNDDGEVNFSAQNQWNSDTGKTYDENTSKRAPIMMGDKFFDFDTFSAGAPKFKAYSDDRDLAQALKIQKAQGDVKAPSNIAEIIRLQNKPNKTEEDRDTLRTYRAKEGVLKSHAVKTLNSDDNKALYDKNENLTDEDDNTIARAVTNELDAGLGEYKDSNKIGPGIAAVDTLNQTANTLTTMDVAEGMKESGLVEAAKYLNSEEFTNLEPAAQRKVLQTIEARSGLGINATKILQSISGQAVPDSEYERFMGNLVGGDIKNINTKSIISALKGASEALYNNTKANIKSSVPRTRAGTRADYFRNLEKVWNPVSPKVTEGGEMKLEEVPEQVIDTKVEEVSEATKALKDKFLAGELKGEELEKFKALPLYKQLLVSAGLMDTPKVSPNIPKADTNKPKSKDAQFFDGFNSITEVQKALPNMTEDQKNYYKANKVRLINMYINKKYEGK